MSEKCHNCGILTSELFDHFGQNICSKCLKEWQGMMQRGIDQDWATLRRLAGEIAKSNYKEKEANK